VIFDTHNELFTWYDLRIHLPDMCIHFYLTVLR